MNTGLPLSCSFFFYFTFYTLTQVEDLSTSTSRETAEVSCIDEI